MLWLQSLLFMNFGHNQFIDYQTDTCLAMKTDGQLGRCNRACNTGSLSHTEIESIKTFFNNVPFTWVIDEQETQNRQLLEENALLFKGYFPALYLDLQQLIPQTITDITVKEIIEPDDFNTWVSIASHSYHYLGNRNEFIKALQFLKNRAQENIKFYIGYYKGEPAATSMVVYHGDSVSIHFVGTLELFRHKGLGRSMLSIPLSAAKECGYLSAILMASADGLSLAKQLGFEEYTTYAIYGNY